MDRLSSGSCPLGLDSELVVVGIADLLQREAVGLHHAHSLVAPSPGHYLGRPAGGPASLTYCDQAADQRAHHVVAEGVGAHRADDETCVVPPPGEVQEGADGGRTLPLLAEGGEVTQAEERRGRVVHRIEVEAAGPRQHVPPHQRVGELLAVGDAVGVAPPDRGEAGIEPAGGLEGPLGRTTSGLGGPAGEVGAVVGTVDPQAHAAILGRRRARPRSGRLCSTRWLTTPGAAAYGLFNQSVEEGASVTDPLSRVFAALADPTRRDMVARLTEGDHTVNDLAAPYDVSLQAVSKHLKVLEDAGLVTRSREAQRRPVHLEAEVFDLMTKWIERYRRQAEERFARLDAVLARMQDDENGTTATTQQQEGTAS